MSNNLSLGALLIRETTGVRTWVFLTSSPNSQPVEKTVLGCSYILLCQTRFTCPPKNRICSHQLKLSLGGLNKHILDDFPGIIPKVTLENWTLQDLSSLLSSVICHSRITPPVPWPEDCLCCSHLQGHATPAAIHASKMIAPLSVTWHPQS